MPNVQFCPVCGYAMKKMESQCGRCGETTGEDRNHEETVRREYSPTRFTGGYTIEAIGLGGEIEPTGSGLHSISEGYGIRDVSSQQVKEDEKDKSINDLQKELKDLNERIAKMGEEKRADPPKKKERPQAHSSKQKGYKSELIGHYRRRNDPEFLSLVGTHLSNIREAIGKVQTRRMSESYHKFMDESIISPGIYDSSVVLFVGPPGSMKSTMAANAVASMARNAGSRVLYILLDDGRRKFNKRLSDMNIQVRGDEVIRIADSKEIRRRTSEVEGNWRTVIMEYIKLEYSKSKFQFLVLDNLNAMYSMVNSDRDRKGLFTLFDWVREMGVTAIAIKEGEFPGAIRGRSAEAYLADGVIQFHRRKGSDGTLVPMFRVLKMRGAEIDSRYFALQISSGNLRFVPAIAI